MTFPWELIILLLIAIWQLGITLWFFKMQKHYQDLTHGVNKKNLEEVLTQLLKEVTQAKKDIGNLAARCDSIEQDSKLHIQKIGLLRFNPFKDTGGDQSFILSFIDAKNTGIVISGLYSRSGTRWYAKKVKDGKGLEYELSQDEKKAIEIAKNSV